MDDDACSLREARSDLGLVHLSHLVRDARSDEHLDLPDLRDDSGRGPASVVQRLGPFGEHRLDIVYFAHLAPATAEEPLDCTELSFVHYELGPQRVGEALAGQVIACRAQSA